MTIKYDVGVTYGDMPEPFCNFYRSLSPAFLIFEHAAEKLNQEPYNATLCNHSGHWWIEFPTQEDYVAFLMRWS